MAGTITLTFAALASRTRNYRMKLPACKWSRCGLNRMPTRPGDCRSLLDFKEKFISKTVAAQVIATSGTEQSRLITIDKGSNDHIKPDMPVITPDGIVGKVKEVFPLSSQVLLINDHDSGAGVILENSRLQGDCERERLWASFRSMASCLTSKWSPASA